MNEGRMSAIDIKMAKAGPLNGYVELPPELEAVPWVKQGMLDRSVFYNYRGDVPIITSFPSQKYIITNI